jgi:oxygen-independent coproporphyrinogen-3 oxidase
LSQLQQTVLPEHSKQIGLYLHIPFCVRKCPYCDFNSYERAGGAGTFADEEKRYIDALCKEIVTALKPEGIWQNRLITTIFFGGGTPSLLEPKSIQLILDTVRSNCAVTEDAEVTVESNPGTISENLGSTKLSGYRQAGVNRISLGGQSFAEKKLKFLGRIHSPEAIPASVNNIRAAGFTNFNIDLMFGAAEETPAEWQLDLEQALALEPTHLSVYSLTIEPGTEFGRMARSGKKLTGGDETTSEMFTLTQERLERSGFQQYEISNYAKVGYECRHNLGYWRRQPYLGVGAGAASLWLGRTEAEQRAARLVFDADYSDSGVRWTNIPGPSHYSERIESGRTAHQKVDPLDQAAAQIEVIFLGLRTFSGLDLGNKEKLFSARQIAQILSTATKLESQGLVRIEEREIKITRKGALFINNVTESLVDCLT